MHNALIFKTVRFAEDDILGDLRQKRDEEPAPVEREGIEIRGTRLADDLSADDPVDLALLRAGDDTFESAEAVDMLRAGRGDDMIQLDSGATRVELGQGDDKLVSDGFVFKLNASTGNDTVTLNDGGGKIGMGFGDDVLKLGALVETARGGFGDDTLEFDFNLGDVDIQTVGRKVEIIDRFTGETMKVGGFETFEFKDITLSLEEIRDTYAPDALPSIRVGGGTQNLTVNDADPTVSVVWDRVVQQAVIVQQTDPGSDDAKGPTIATRAYAMVHTAMYDAWATYDDTAVRVSLDSDGDNASLALGAIDTDLNQQKAMSYAAFTVLNHLYPTQADFFAEVMQERYGYSLTDDGSKEAAIGIDAAEDLIALRINDGSNQENGFAGDFTPTNPSPLEINDITAWTPENVPIDPEDGNAEQSFLTPHWGGVESFALAENPDGSTNFDETTPPPPQPFFVDAQSGAVLDFDAAEITLGADVTIDGTDYSAGDVIPVSKALIGPVINAGFIEQAEHVVNLSANLNDEQKIIAEFWEDAGGTSFPPGTFLTFAEFVSARDGNTLDEDAALFLALSNSGFDAGVATWQAKVEFDYVRPVRAIRDLGELGLIGEMGVDELTGETGYVIQAFGGIDPDTGEGLGTRTILAENFVTFQRPLADPSPPFAEYVSGHSTFSAAGAEVLRLITGSDYFGGSVVFAPGSTQFEAGVPFNEVTLSWDTFTEAKDEAGMSRLYGGIHFTEGDLNGRELGRELGQNTYDLVQRFLDGSATDQDRPFFVDEFILT